MLTIFGHGRPSVGRSGSGRPRFLARWRRRTGLYDSMKKGAGTITSTTVKNKITHAVQRQPRDCVTAAPSSGPIAGPKNGVATYSDMGPDRFSGGQMSLSVPDPILKLGAAKKPEKKRRTTSAAMLCAKPVPRVKSAKMGRLMKITRRLPNVSLRGAANGPPNARPSE